MQDSTNRPLYSQSAADLPNEIGERLTHLLETDSQFRAAMPSPALNDAKAASGLGFAQLVALCMEGYADRPALAQRVAKLSTDPVTGRTSRTLLKEFESISYRDLWARSRALATFWQRDAVQKLLANDRISMMGFGGTDFVAVDLAAIHNGAVVIPMQVNAGIQQSLAIFNEIAPHWVATTIENLDLAVELVTQGHHPRGLLVIEYHAEVDEERARFESAQAKLAVAGLPGLLVTLDQVCALGEKYPSAPVFAESPSDQRLCTIYYTSGSTGLPKGAMLPESMLKPLWDFASPIPQINVLFMPLNHASGRSIVFATLGCGGTGYFTAKSDLSELTEDIGHVRPTGMMFVPRICEMINQHYKVALERRAPSAGEMENVKRELILEIRNTLLGGRMLMAHFASAPLAPELRRFMATCLGFPMEDMYGATEFAGALHNTRVMRPPIVDYKLDDVPELGYFKTDKPHPRGELRIKTESIMLGYYKRPDVTASVFDEEGYYKTGDIMEEVGPEQLVYLDRRNNVLKLAQGEFVAIARLEAVFTNGHSAIKQVYLYGTSDRAYLVGVVVPNEETIRHAGIAGNAEATKDLLRQAIQEVARTEQLKSYEVPRDFLVEHEPFSVKNGLLAGIGKYQRPKFKDRYTKALEALYDRITAGQNDELEALRRSGADAPVLETLRRAVRATLGLEDGDLSDGVSFVNLGGDSLSALSLSLLLEDVFHIEVPASVINNPAGSLQDLGHYIERARSGALKIATFASVHGREALEVRASDLKLDAFIDSAVLNAAETALPPAAEIRTVLLTGANGYLGRFLALEWLERMAACGGRVICVTRGRSAAEARQRIAEVFAGDPELKNRFDRLAAKHLEVLTGDLGEPQLGVSSADWQRLAKTVDLIVHPAALVNHVLPYQQLFGPNVVGTAELIRLAITHRLKPINAISTIAAAATADSIIDEKVDLRLAMPVRRLTGDAYADGYAASKWAAEVLLREAYERFGLPVSVFRSDMILAHSRYRGQLNVPDMFTRLLISVVLTGLAPRSFYGAGKAAPHYAGLPVDFTASAIATLGGHALSGFHTYNVTNSHDDGISLDTFVDWMIAAGHPIRRIDDYADWYGRFETALRALPEAQRQHSSLPLLHQLEHPTPVDYGSAVQAALFRADVIRYEVGGGKDIPHVSEGLIRKYLADLTHLNLI